MTASPPLIIKSVEIATGRQPFLGKILKLRPNLVRIRRFERRDAEFPVTRSSRIGSYGGGRREGYLWISVLAILGVFGSLIGSVLCFVKGCTYVVSSFTDYFADGCKGVLLLVEAIDIYLLGTVMLVFGMGLYELFVSNLSIAKSILKENVHQSSLFGLFTLKERPRWLEIKTVSELKTKLGHVIVMLLLIGLLDKSKKAIIHSPMELLCFSASVLLSSCCLFFLSKLTDSD
ncbi:hypothetical protein SLA2020_457560 [Shorea laevis]